MSEEKTNTPPEATAEEDKRTEAPEAAQAQEGQAAAEAEEALSAARAEAAQYREEMLRARADLENARRRHERELEGARRYALEAFIQELLPVVDSLELGLAAVSEDNPELAKFREGSELTLKMLLNLLEKYGVTPVNPVGEKFNPELHQAMSMQESGEAEPGTVLTVVQKGYRLHDRVVRPAMVIVAKAPEAPQEGNQIDERA